MEGKKRGFGLKLTRRRECSMERSGSRPREAKDPKREDFEASKKKERFSCRFIPERSREEHSRVTRHEVEERGEIAAVCTRRDIVG